MSTGNKFEKFIGSGKIKFRKASLDDLCNWGRACLTTFLSGYDWELGDRKVGKAYILKILNHPLVKYVDVLPDSQRFLLVKDEGHHEGLHPDELLVWNLSRQGVKASVLINEKDGSSVLTAGGMTVVDNHSRKER